MLDHLEPHIQELEQKADQLEAQEAVQLRLVLVQCRQMLTDGDFITADTLLHQIAQRINYLIN